MSSGPKGPIQLKIGEMVGNYKVKKKLGEGSYGKVYLVAKMKDNKECGRAAMKVEPRMHRREEEILRMEIHVLSHIQSRHVPKLLASGELPSFTYLVMTLLGRELEDIRRRLPQRRISATSTLRIGIQLLIGMRDMHEAGYIHRDVKPSYMAMGFQAPKMAYIFDFGLARQIMFDDPKGNKVLRTPRSKALFRGTHRYVSLNIHRSKEAGRQDDLISLLYSLVECVNGQLPWKLKTRKEVDKLKATITEDQLCKDCPPSFTEMAKKTLTYTDKPAYEHFILSLKADLPKGMGGLMTAPYEWTKTGVQADEFWEDKSTLGGVVSEREAAMRERAEQADNATDRDIPDSEVTVTQEAKDETDLAGPLLTRDDTID